ncbi:LytR family transcriptional regulator, partial [bacterium]|nr:LytR family transcriptional regulator [bacterium]
MKKRLDNQVDGFVRRQIGRPIGHLHAEENQKSVSIENATKELHTGTDLSNQTASGFEERSIKRIDIDQSLQNIEQTEKSNGLSLSSAKRIIFNKLKLRKIFKWTLVLVISTLLCVAVYVGYKLIIAGGNVFTGNVFDIFKSEPLLQDDRGRSNFLIFGTAEDDEGGDHGGKWLTDSIMLLSVDQKNKNAYMLSIPRDLWVKYESVCEVGYQGKINSVYYCESNDGKDDKAGSLGLMKKVKEVTGFEIQYYIHLNFTAVVKAVDAVGGVQVVIESDDPRGIFDDNFDWKCKYKCNMVK